MRVSDDRSVKLHVGQCGDVWMGVGDFEPEPRWASPFALLQDPSPLLDARVVRVLGDTRNAGLIVALSRLNPGPLRIEVATPRLCLPRELADPRRAIMAARGCQLPPAVGGWHALTPGDVATYKLAIAMSPGLAHPDAAIEAAVAAHPAWHALRFAHGATPTAVAKVLAAIVDPRWHVDPAHPDRGARLRNHMGLYGRGAARAMRGLASNERERRATCVLAAALGGGEPTGDSPRGFLWRIVSQDPGKRGELRAVSRYLTYLRFTWLQACSPLVERLFDPDLFFKRADEIDAYKAHMRAAPATDK